MELAHALFLWGDPVEYLLVLALALALDALYPYHRGVLLLAHPVRTSYKLALRLHRPFSSRLWGAALALLVLLSHLTPYAFFLVASHLAWEPFHVLAGAWVLKLSIGNRLLYSTVKGVAKALEEANLREARLRVSGLVRRDTRRLGEGHVSSAAVESLSESLVDGLISPLFYYFLAGPLGALFQRVVNTLDGAVGFRDPEYAREGWFSARLDTLVNYLPARLTAAASMLVCVSRPFRKVLECTLRWRKATPSVNAGYPMSVFACCLKVKLEKPGAYALGEGGLPGPQDIQKALRLYLAAAGLLVALLALAGAWLRLPA